MKSTFEIIEELNEILLAKEPIRMGLIKQFQNKIWADENIKDEVLSEILTEVSYDLDFYEPNEEWRKEDGSYYGNDRLEEVLLATIKQLEKWEKKHLE